MNHPMELLAKPPKKLSVKSHLKLPAKSTSFWPKISNGQNIILETPKIQTLTPIIDRKPDTDLMDATLYRKVKSVKLLINAEVIPNLVYSFGCTPLTVAMEKDDLESIKALIEGSANVNLIGKWGYTSFSYVVKLGHDKLHRHDYLKIIELLINYGASVNQIFDSKDARPREVLP